MECGSQVEIETSLFPTNPNLAKTGEFIMMTLRLDTTLVPPDYAYMDEESTFLTSYLVQHTLRENRLLGNRNSCYMATDNRLTCDWFTSVSADCSPYTNTKQLFSNGESKALQECEL